MKEKEKDILSSIDSIEDIKNVIPKVLPVLPLRDIVIFPNMIFPVLIGRDSSLKAIASVSEGEKFIYLATQHNPDVNEPSFSDITQHGTIAKILQVLRLPNNLYKVLVEGVCQGEIVSKVENKEFLEAEIKEQKISYSVRDKELIAIMRTTGAMFANYIKRNPMLQADILTSYDNILDPLQKLYFAAANIKAKIEEKLELLNQRELKKQYYILTSFLSAEIELQDIENEIGEKIQTTFQSNQKKYVIQEHIRTLQKELGEEGMPPEIKELSDAIKAAKLPKEAKEKANEELSRLTKMQPMAPEYALSRNYIEWLIKVPWHETSQDNYSIKKVKEVLEKDHFGLKEPKDRIVEYIALLNLTENLKRQILCFSGPPGTGKTSLARSIAKALDREFVRFSLGGVRDEAEIRGHRRTYVGALPGKIIQSMKKVGKINPVMLLDEIDKMSMDFRGDPSAALLEVLDPEQNSNFQDHFLEIDYDLSNVLFITTANVSYEIPAPLLDRMEVIELSSYTKEEKLEIAKRHIIPKIIEEYAMQEYGITCTDEAILTVITNYTREPGVRELERQMSSILRKISTQTVADYQKKSKAKSNKPLKKNRYFIKSIQEQEFIVDNDVVLKHLKAPKFKDIEKDLQNAIGLVKGLAWTQVGGSVMPIEASLMPGSEHLMLTGKLGDVMKESAQSALSYVRSNTDKYKIESNFYSKKDLHIHVPEGAIPKDGPSAGITMTMAILSIAANIEVKGDIAMTGEVTLRGNILPIGGIKEKLLAAKKSGIKKIIVPKDNESDIINLENDVSSDIEIIFVAHVDEAIPHVFCRDIFKLI